MVDIYRRDLALNNYFGLKNLLTGTYGWMDGFKDGWRYLQSNIHIHTDIMIDRYSCIFKEKFFLYFIKFSVLYFCVFSLNALNNYRKPHM